ncbi:URC4/urg3 family protein [Rhodoplanes sp. Z2-YC6860]|uniref:URC4/urg3 family protein n=1 Tax=Rhodoplanes sp. Z2-YC6860 TaxID=674703 RepID=UPI0012EE3A90|nr:URC4/urg3 family protein [Rhodoplanes sp. Z2-YC6860]
MSEASAAKSLLNASAVRERAHKMLALGDQLPNFRVDLGKLEGAAQLVIDTTRAAYPTLDVPFHSRWRHFDIDGFDYWKEIDEAMAWPSPAERSRTAMDLAIISVLLDAGAGPGWRFLYDVSGEYVSRSEGLALASLVMFRNCEFSKWPSYPLRVDGEILAALTEDKLIKGFQVTAQNPLAGVAGRVALLRRLGQTVLAKPEVFGTKDTPRPGGIFDHLASLAENGRIAAPVILREVLTHLGPIWPSRLTLGGIALGDCWKHASMKTDDATNGLVPLHKLSQWLSYSLIEPLQWVGIEVTDIDGLTGLAEYRNGGLFIDTDVLTLRDPAAAQREHTVDSELVVEWRTLTVALLDRLADVVRTKLNMDRQSLPLARILQGGTWTAGRSVAKRKRADGGPPLKIVSDGTVF